MNKKLVHIIFDFDGTLWNSSLPVRNSLKYALMDKGYLELANDLPKFEIGRPMEIILEKEFDFMTSEAKDTADVFRSYLTQEDLKTGKFYEGVQNVLSKLIGAGYKLSIATFKRKKLVENILKQHSMSDMFYQIKGLGEDGLRSKTELVKECISKQDICTLMIGDTISDYQAALDNNIDFYLVKYGYGYKSLEDRVIDENIKVIDCFEEILKIVNGESYGL